MKNLFIIPLLFLFVSSAYGQGSYDAILSAKALSEAGRDKEAISQLTDAIIKGASSALYSLRGDIYLSEGLIKEAKNDYMAAESLEAGSGLYGLARCAARSGDAVVSVACLESLLKSRFKKTEPEILLDESFASITSSPEWKSFWRKEWYRGFERMTWEIEHYIKINRVDLASEVFSNMSATYPDMPSTEYCKALIAISKGSYSEAREALIAISEEGNADPKYLLALARANAGDGNFFEAAKDYGRLISAAFPDATLYLNRAEMLVRAGDTGGAIDDIKQYLIYYPDDFRALSLLGQAYASQGSIYEALPYLNSNIENHPGEPKAFSLRGDAYFGARTWDKAADDYAMSLDLDPENPVVNLNLGITLINCGKPEEACHYLKKAKDGGEKKATQYISKYCIK